MTSIKRAFPVARTCEDCGKPGGTYCYEGKYRHPKCFRKLRRRTLEEIEMSCGAAPDHILMDGAKRVEGKRIYLTEPSLRSVLKRHGYFYVPRKGFWFRVTSQEGK